MASNQYKNNRDPVQLEYSGDSRSLLHQISTCANQNIPRVDFLRKVSKILLEFARCDEIGLWIKNDDKENCYKIIRHTARKFYFKTVSFSNNSKINTINDNIDLNQLCKEVNTGHHDFSFNFILDEDTFNKVITSKPVIINSKPKKTGHHSALIKYKSILIIPLLVGDKRIGILNFKKREVDFFSKKILKIYENFAQTFSILLMSQRAQAALRERIKELSCLYEMAHTVERPDISLDEIIQHAVELIPRAWQYPKIAHGRIILDGRSYKTAGYRDGPHRQITDILVKGEKRGTIEVVYDKEKIDIFEGPFLREERSLIDSMARELSRIIEQKLTSDYNKKLNDQLRHADRLATIGQLAAGIAHELNEPLCNILGFSQLIEKKPELPGSAKQDMEKIINASLHAREIIKKLLFFSRQVPAQKTGIDLNETIREGLYFLEARCAREGIGLIYSLDPDLPKIVADPSQMVQVMVNLVVNSIQSMPNGGSINIRTIAGDSSIMLTVEDTGVGMSEEAMKKIFIPFYTTKDINAGTGLGLPVVHGIISSHGGSVRVHSEVGQGTRFELELPVTQ